MSDDPPPRKRMVKPPTGGTESGRVVPERLKTAWKRTPSQQAWLNRQINDPFAAKARAHGYRSRAAYKLTELDDKLRLLKPGARVVDLGAAPGGWTQVALERGVTHIVGVDLLPVDPLPPAIILEMDFTDPTCGPELIRLLGGAPDLVMSDIAPNTVGHRQTDHLRIVVVLRYYADLSEREIAIAIDRKTGTVKSRLNEARRRLAMHPALRPEMSAEGLTNEEAIG